MGFVWRMGISCVFVGIFLGLNWGLGCWELLGSPYDGVFGVEVATGEWGEFGVGGWWCVARKWRSVGGVLGWVSLTGGGGVGRGGP